MKPSTKMTCKRDSSFHYLMDSYINISLNEKEYREISSFCLNFGAKVDVLSYSLFENDQNPVIALIILLFEVRMRCLLVLIPKA